MRFMMIDTCDIIMNNHTCEIINFISGKKSTKHTILYNKNTCINKFTYRITEQGLIQLKVLYSPNCRYYRYLLKQTFLQLMQCFYAPEYDNFRIK